MIVPTSHSVAEATDRIIRVKDGLIEYTVNEESACLILTILGKYGAR